MTRYRNALMIAALLGISAYWPQPGRADEVTERRTRVKEHDDGYEVKETEKHHGKAHDKKVHIKERVETDDEGNEVRHREERIEHDND
jgi:hypothetical protein